MAMITAAAASGSAAGAYRNIFDGYVIKRTQTMLKRVQQALQHTPRLPEKTLKTALYSLEYAFKLPPAWPHTRDLLLAMAPDLEQTGYRDAWISYLRQGLDLSHQFGDVEAEINLLISLARLRFQQSRFRQMVSAYRQVIRLSRRHDDPYNLARALTNLGFYYVETGYWQRAEVLCCRALRLFETLDNSHGLAHTHNHLGTLRIWQERWTDAEHHLQQAVHLWRAMGDTANLAIGLNNLGLLFNTIEQPEQALPWLQEAETCAKSVENENTTALIYTNLGIAYRQQSAYTTAAQYFWQAHTVYNRLQNLFKLASVLNHLGLLYRDWQRRDEAKQYFLEAEELWRGINNSYYCVQSTLNLVEIELVDHNVQKAHDWLVKAESLLSQLGPTERYHALWRRLEEAQARV